MTIRNRLMRARRAGIELALDPHVLRTLAIRTAQRWQLGSYEFRVGIGAVDRPHYAYCVWQAAALAKKLHEPRISIIEFGVAGGNGLVNLEQHAGAASAALGVAIDVYGFDTGKGLPPPTDYRDLPHHFQSGFFEMDEAALRSRIQSATLLLGEISTTLPTFVDTFHPAPIGAVMQDFDFYSSTKTALTLFDVEDKYRMPRIFTYFDDIIGDEISLYNDYTGERLAIAEFNASHETNRISPAYHLLKLPREPWHAKIFVEHDFAHPRYNDYIGAGLQQLPLHGT